MKAAPGVSGLGQIADGDIIHYWFEVDDTQPHRVQSRTVRVTDPAAHTVDWHLTADSGNQPAAVVQFARAKLNVCDPAGEKPDFSGDVPLDELPANNNLVIYELPTAWTPARRDKVRRKPRAARSGMSRPARQNGGRREFRRPAHSRTRPFLPG